MHNFTREQIENFLNYAKDHETIIGGKVMYDIPHYKFLNLSELWNFWIKSNE